MMKRAVFPGSFDPITIGHRDIVERALHLFDEIIIAIGINADKKYMFSLEDRIAFIENTFKGKSKIRVATYTGLTVDFCKAESAFYILRGLRSPSDFTYERSIAQANVKLAGIETVFLISSPALSYISSSIVRDVARNGGNYSMMVPDAVKP